MAFMSSTLSLPLAEVLNASLNGVVILQPVLDDDKSVTDFSFTFINNRVFDKPGLLNGWQAGMSLREWYRLQGRPGLFKEFVNVFHTGEPLHLNNFQSQDNDWYELAVARIDGQVLLTFHEVSQTQGALNQMQQQRDLLQLILDTSPAGIVLFEAVRDTSAQISDFRYVLTNPANARTTDRTVAEMTGQLLSVISPTAYQGDFFRLLVEVAESGVGQQLTFPFVGERIRGWFEASMVRQGDGVLFVFQDITALKESEQQQQQQAQLLQTVMDIAQTSISLHQSIRKPQPDDKPGPIQDFRTELANKQALNDWGGFSNRFLNQTFWESQADLPNVAAIFDRLVHVVETGQSTSWEAKLPTNDSWHKILAAKAGDGLVIASIDITETHLYQQRLEATNTSLNQLNEKLQRFAAVASHDLQEPLGKIKYYSDVLLHEYKEVLDKEGISLLTTMQGAAERMQRLIDNLLFYAKLEADKAEIEPVLLGELVQQVIEDLSISMQSVSLAISPLPEVTGDPTQLNQLIQNLLSNALKYRRSDVPLHIDITADRVSTAALPQLSPRPIQPSPSEYWRIRFIDNGVGFDPKHADRIFQSFQRLSNQTVGTGLGLAICKQVAENHRGFLTASGQPNQGATFSLYLPASA